MSSMAPSEQAGVVQTTLRKRNDWLIVEGTMASQKQTLGSKINSLREKAGLSLGQLAEASGTTKVTILRLERDEFAQPRPDKLTAIAKALDVDPAVLLKLAGYANKENLPSIAPYLRTKYGGVIPADKLKEMSEYFEQVAAEYSADKKQPTKRRTKGGR